MRKLTLDLDSVAVESFPTSAGPRAPRGTVEGRAVQASQADCSIDGCSVDFCSFYGCTGYDACSQEEDCSNFEGCTGIRICYWTP